LNIIPCVPVSASVDIRNSSKNPVAVERDTAASKSCLKSECLSASGHLIEAAASAIKNNTNGDFHKIKIENAPSSSVGIIGEDEVRNNSTIATATSAAAAAVDDSSSMPRSSLTQALYIENGCEYCGIWKVDHKIKRELSFERKLKNSFKAWIMRIVRYASKKSAISTKSLRHKAQYIQMCVQLFPTPQLLSEGMTVLLCELRDEGIIANLGSSTHMWIDASSSSSSSSTSSVSLHQKTDIMQVPVSTVKTESTGNKKPLMAQVSPEYRKLHTPASSYQLHRVLLELLRKDCVGMLERMPPSQYDPFFLPEPLDPCPTCGAFQCAPHHCLLNRLNRFSGPT
jgi:hypothetical protein